MCCSKTPRCATCNHRGNCHRRNCTAAYPPAQPSQLPPSYDAVMVPQGSASVATRGCGGRAGCGYGCGQGCGRRGGCGYGCQRRQCRGPIRMLVQYLVQYVSFFAFLVWTMDADPFAFVGNIRRRREGRVGCKIRSDLDMLHTVVHKGRMRWLLVGKRKGMD